MRHSAAMQRSLLTVSLALIAVLVIVAWPQGTRAAPQANTYLVTRYDDPDPTPGCQPADCSLREAVRAANANAGTDLIELPAGTYVLTITGGGEDLGRTGDLDIRDNVIISGTSTADTIIEGSVDWADRLLHVVTGTAQIERVTLRNGHANSAPAFGGALYNQGTVTLIDLLIEHNSAFATGGGLANNGQLTLINSVVLSNTSTSGGGLDNYGVAVLSDTQFIDNYAKHATTGRGGALSSSGVLTVTNSLFRLNQSSHDGAGIYFFSFKNRFHIADSQFLTNTAGRRGGAMDVEYSTGTIVSSTFVGNSATYGGGVSSVASTVTLTSGVFISNTAGTGGGVEGGRYVISSTRFYDNRASNGGGLYLYQGSVQASTIETNTAYASGGGLFITGYGQVAQALVRGNTAPSGGGAYVTGWADILESTFHLNRATFSGAGLFNNTGTSVIERSLFYDNRSQGGGGGISSRGIVTISNSTFSANQAGGEGGGGLLNLTRTSITPTTYLRSATIAYNSSSGDGGGVSISAIDGGNIDVANTLIAHNVDTGLSTSAPDCYGVITSRGYNLLFNTSNCTLSGTLTGVITNTAPLLGGLQDNGGATWTHALLAGSPARNAANPALPDSDPLACLWSDQRGSPRPIGPRCDIGAYEDHYLTPQTITFDPIADHPITDPIFSVTATATSGLSVTVASRTPAVCAVNNHVVTLLGGGVCTLRASQPGDATYGAATIVDRSFISVLTQTLTFNPLPDRLFTAPPFTLAASASSNLPVAFNAGGVCAVNGITVTLSGAIGVCTITATQAGNAYYLAALPVARSFNVVDSGILTQTITFAPIADRFVSESPFSIAPTASSGLSVTVTSLTTDVCTIDNNLVALMSAGLCTLHATQPGNAAYAPAPEVDRSFTVKAHGLFLPLVQR